ncbi:hypothetical protein D1BOALGB6SA_231 [Olavius sp. associated proteobacterium Delta 1]|nr:hypothetical protein D1BOALGB6SA_231 [Olavius sp. associated proteobacterium Delta 1]
MSYEYHIGVLDEEAVVAECGPMRLVIRAWKKRQPQIEIARGAAEESIRCLEQVACCRMVLSRPVTESVRWPKVDLAIQMITSVKAIGDNDLTPMAAVAGTIADAVADWLVDQKMDRVIVDNGGDIALRLEPGETATVGIRPQVDNQRVSHVLHLDGSQPAWGVTTSGIGGRSLTRGIASAVTVVAASASVADAAATAIGNACFVEDGGIVQVPAESLDPHTDLAGLSVTTEVGELLPEKILTALESARQKAEVLAQRKIIRGAFMTLQNVFAISDGLKPYIFPVSGIGD